MNKTFCNGCGKEIDVEGFKGKYYFSCGGYELDYCSKCMKIMQRELKKRLNDANEDKNEPGERNGK